jgi:hypothetical protein
MPLTMFRAVLLALVLLLATGAQASAPTDGPYVFHSDAGSHAHWVCDGEVRVHPVDAAGVIEPLCGDVPALWLDQAATTAPDRLPEPSRWAALSDVHGRASLMLRLLHAQRIIDRDHRWAWGDGVLVVAGDVFDRGPEQLQALWALYRLAMEAAADGGRVELLIGNHEAMVLAGDLRYLHPRYPVIAERLGRPYDGLFAADSELGAWLRRRATVLQLGDSLILHGGLHPGLATASFDPARLNAAMRARLGLSKQALQDDPEGAWLFGRDGPLWYRGYFVPERASLTEIDALLAAAGVARMVVGHTTSDRIRAWYDGRVISVDADMKSGTSGELLIREDGRFWRGMLDGRRLPLADDGADDVARRAPHPALPLSLRQ